MHQDIKSLNVVVTEDWDAKWTDFGTAKMKETCNSTVVAQSREHSGATGTFKWMSPEEVKGRVTKSRKSDIYSFGVVLWELTSHKEPYEQLSWISAIPKIYNMETETIPEDTPAPFAKAIRHCWFQNPKDRPTAKQLADYFANKGEGVTLPDPTIQQVPQIQNNNNTNNNNNNKNNSNNYHQLT